jgi:hypothetical protein
MVSVRRVAPILLLAVTIPALAAVPKSSSTPPRELHRVGDHWTAYNPPDPTTYPAGAKTYTIKAGDTLWALAQQFYNNAYLWPQLWETNTWITDAHWIYPGDVLLVEGEVAAQAAEGTTGQQPAAGGPAVGSTAATTQPSGAATGTEMGLTRPLTIAEVTAADAVGGTTSPVPLATEADIYCYGYIGDPGEQMPNSITSYEDVDVRYQPGALRQDITGATGDLVFVDGGTSTGLASGETYMLIVPQGLIEHPRTHEMIGRQYEYRGQIRILCAEATQSRAIITQSCSEIPVGTRLKPMPQLPIPLARIPSMPAFCDPASGKTTGYIISSRGGDWLTGLGEGYLVQINLGREEQVQPGEFLTVFRESPQSGQPREVLGEIAVLTAEAHTATAKIVLMRRVMRVGDQLEIR